MPLDDLVEVIETLKERIRDHGDSLRQNETRTRMALIDPLLAALGWDVSDPKLVTAEYDVSGRRADYALLGTGNIPAATVEAKKLNEPLEPHRLQMLNYSNAAGIRFAGLTDGNRWEFYEIFKQGTLEERRILEAVISSEPSAHLALRFLLLWRSNLETGRTTVAEEPIFSTGSGDELEVPIAPFSPLGNWQSIASIRKTEDVKFPTSLLFPNEREREVKKWRDVLIEVAEWLIREGNLTQEKCPIAGSLLTKTRYVIHSVAEHDAGKSFDRPYKLSNGCFLEAHSGDWARVRSKGLVSELRRDPNSVQIQIN